MVLIGTHIHTPPRFVAKTIQIHLLSFVVFDSMTPEDMEKLITEMENMPEAQRAQLKSMGMDPDTSEYNSLVIV